MTNPVLILCCVLIVSGIWSQSVVANTSVSAEKKVNNLSVRIRARNPEQISAFYEARGFPKKALGILSKHCFLTVTIRNYSNNIVWLVPEKWSIQPQNRKVRPIAPLTSSYWGKEWKKFGLAPAYRSTFRWTQLPETRDLRPNEPVGGNITLPGDTGKFALDIVFETGEKRDGPAIRMRFEHLSCANSGNEVNSTK